MIPLGTLVSVLGFILVAYTQVIKPLNTGAKIFPFFRSEGRQRLAAARKSRAESETQIAAGVEEKAASQAANKAESLKPNSNKEANNG